MTMAVAKPCHSSAREFEIGRRSLAMLPPESPIIREKAIALIVRCQRAIDAARDHLC